MKIHGGAARWHLWAAPCGWDIIVKWEVEEMVRKTFEEGSSSHVSEVLIYQVMKHNEQGR